MSGWSRLGFVYRRATVKLHGSNARGSAAASRTINEVSAVSQASEDETRMLVQLVDAQWYLDQYHDVLTAGQDPVSHYLSFGVNEHRNPNAFFDAYWYLYQYPDVAGSRINPALHYIRCGAGEGRDPHEAFSTCQYLKNYPDVADSGQNALVHFIQCGRAEGRSAFNTGSFNANNHVSTTVSQASEDEVAMLMDLVDAQWYLAQYPDVAAAGQDPVTHYIACGVDENRNPNAFFDVYWYLYRYPDVAGSRVNPALHYIRSGADEGRDPHEAFSTRRYIQNYPDVRNSGHNPLAHFIHWGRIEGRHAEPISDFNPDDERVLRESGLFDVSWYLSRYADVAATGMDPLVHYIKHGSAERRDPNPLFNTTWYLKSYPDVEREGVNPLLHYVKYGQYEERDPSASFSTSWYAATYPDVDRADMLLHYLTIGQKEGRLGIDPNADYTRRVLELRQRFALESQQFLEHIEIMLLKPFFVIVIEGNNEKDREQTVASIQRQIYKHWEIVASRSDESRLRQEEFAEDNFLVWLEAGDILNERALYSFASCINAYPAMDLIYADEDVIDSNMCRSEPFFKPSWSPDYLESLNYISFPACFRGSIVERCLALSEGYYDFVLRFTEFTTQIWHIDEVLCHKPRDSKHGEVAHSSISDKVALKGRLKRTGRNGEVTAISEACRCYDLKIRLSTTPLVSIIIPTAGKIVDIEGRRLDLLMNCVEKISSTSSYKNIEFVIVDNGDLGRERTKLLKERGCKTITFEDPVFNISKKLNLGASIASGDMLLLMNDDIEPLRSDWIERLLEHFEKSHVGVVGAKLLYPSLETQHVGIVFNSGNPDHVRRWHDRDDQGYFFSTCAVRNFSAVTGAVMMTRADIYGELGGYNEELAISYNDVDYCLKVRQRGFSAVYAPAAELIHFESQSRIATLAPLEAEYFGDHWASVVVFDQYYNERELTVASPTFEVRHNQRLL